MTRNTLFTDEKKMMMHLSDIGSVGVISDQDADIAFEEQEVQELTLTNTQGVEAETLLMVRESGFEVGAINFKTKQVVFVPADEMTPTTTVKSRS